MQEYKYHLRISEPLRADILRIAARAAIARGHDRPFSIADTIRLALRRGLDDLAREADEVLGTEVPDASR